MPRKCFGMSWLGVVRPLGPPITVPEDPWAACPQNYTYALASSRNYYQAQNSSRQLSEGKNVPTTTPDGSFSSQVQGFSSRGRQKQAKTMREGRIRWKIEFPQKTENSQKMLSFRFAQNAINCGNFAQNGLKRPIWRGRCQKRIHQRCFRLCKLKCLNRQIRGLVYTKKLVFKGKNERTHIHQRASQVFMGDLFAEYRCTDLGLPSFKCLSPFLESACHCRYHFNSAYMFLSWFTIAGMEK